MDEALIEDAEHDVDNQNRDDQEQALSAQGGLERLRRPLEAAAQGDGQPQRALERGDPAHRVAQRDPRLQVERDREGGQDAQMVHGEGPGAARDPRDRAQRNQPPSGGANVEHRHRDRVLLVAGLQLQDHPVLVSRGVDRRDLSGAVGVVERVLDLVRREPERRGPVPVDVDDDLRAGGLEVRVDVLEPGQLADPLEEDGGPLGQLLEVRALHGVLVGRLGDGAPDGHGRRDLQVDVHAEHSRQVTPKLRNHLLGGGTGPPGPEADEEPPRVGHDVPRLLVDPDRRHERLARRVVPDDVGPKAHLEIAAQCQQFLVRTITSRSKGKHLGSPSTKDKKILQKILRQAVIRACDARESSP